MKGDTRSLDCSSYELQSKLLRKGYMGQDYRVSRGETRSLDHGSYTDLKSLKRNM